MTISKEQHKLDTIYNWVDDLKQKRHRPYGIEIEDYVYFVEDIESLLKEEDDVEADSEASLPPNCS